MVLKLLPVGLMVCGIAMATQSASAQCQSNAPPGPEPNWNGPSSYQPPGPGQRPMTPPPAPQAPGQKPAKGAMNQPAPMQQGQTAQNNQPYQSFSAEPQAAPMYAPNTYTYPTYGGFYGNGYNGGYYSYPSYGGGWNSGLDNARFHGVNPNAYP